MTTALPANSTGLNIPTSLQICKYVDLEGCALLLRPCSNFLERSKDGGERGEKTAPALHIRACFGLQHQLLVTFFLPPLPAGLWGNAGGVGARTVGAQQHLRIEGRNAMPEGTLPDLDWLAGSKSECERAAGGIDSVLRLDQSHMQEVCKLHYPALLTVYKETEVAVSLIKAHLMIFF